MADFKLENSFKEEKIDIFEDEEDIEPFDFSLLNQAVVSSTDWTTETILSQIKKGNIDLNPKFQRRDAWTGKRKSTFIESLILGFPIPQIVLAERSGDKGRFIIIDGKQRLLSLKQFSSFENEEEKPFDQLKLSGLTIRKDLNGKTLTDLKNDPTGWEDISNLENQTIRTVVIKNWKKEAILYHIFHRLNTNSVPLSPQELRQALHPGRFIDFVDNASFESKALKSILKTNKPDFRMRDVELLVRFFAFKFFLKQYRGQLKEFLDHTCKYFNSNWKNYEKEFPETLTDFENSHQIASEIFGEKEVYRKWTKEGIETRFNRAIFDIISFFFSQPEVRKLALKRKEEVYEGFKNLCINDEEFLSSIESTTKSINATCIRFSKFAAMLNQKLGTNLEIYKVKNKRIV